MVEGRILQLLKERTRSLHESLERRVDLPRRLSALSSYTGLLQRFYAFYAPLEDVLGKVPGWESIGIDPQDRRKSAFLAQDLSGLHVLLPKNLGPEHLPRIHTLGDALGAMYVMEGATLGGQIIRREVARQLSLTPEHGCAFFAAYGDRVGLMWERFRQAVVQYAVTTDREQEVVGAAVDTFQKLEVRLAEDSPV